MKTYILNEIKGKIQGDTIIVKAENALEACKKANMTEIIKPNEKFSKVYFGKVYECYELGTVKTEYIAHQ